MAGAPFRPAHSWLLCMVFLHISRFAYSSQPALDETEAFGQSAYLSEDLTGVVPAQRTPEQLARWRQHRKEEVAALHKDDVEVEDDEETVKRSSSFSQVAYSEEPAAEESAESSTRSEAKLGNTSGAKSGSWVCSDVPIKGCGRNLVIKRSKSTYDYAKYLMGKQPFTNWLSGSIAVFSVLIFGMFTAFFSPQAAIMSTGLVASCQTVMTTAVVQSLMGATLVLSAGLGLTGGLLSQSVASQAGFSWKAIQGQAEVTENFKWLNQQPDKCNEIVFSAEHPMDLRGIEKLSNYQASEAIDGWCRIMNRKDPEGKTLWDFKPDVMPVVTACLEVKTPNAERKKKELHERFTCVDLLAMQDEEMVYQAGLSYFNLKRAEKHLGEFSERDCSETLYTNTPVSTGFGAICQSIKAMEQKRKDDQLFANRQRDKLITGNASLLELHSSRQKVADLSQELLALRKEYAELFAEASDKANPDGVLPENPTPADYAKWEKFHDDKLRMERAETDSSQIPLSKYVWTKEGLAAFAPEDTLWEDDATGKKDLPGSKDKLDKLQERDADAAARAGGPLQVGEEVKEEQLQVLSTMLGIVSKKNSKIQVEDLQRMAQLGYIQKVLRPWEEAEQDKKNRVRKVVVIPAEYKIPEPLTQKQFKAQNQMKKKIKEKEAELQAMKDEVSKTAATHEQLKKSVFNFQVDDKPDNIDDREQVMYGPSARNETGDHVIYVPQPPPPDPAIEADVWDRMAAMKRAEADKAEAIHNCLATASCQLLKKDISALEGGQIKNRFTNKRLNLLTSVTQRCLSHTQLYKGEAFQCQPEGHTFPR